LLLFTYTVKCLVSSDKTSLKPYVGNPFLNIFTALHGVQTRASDENSVCPSVSVKSVDCDKTEERPVQIFTPYKDHLA